jgi:hypothetical protein
MWCYLGIAILEKKKINFTYLCSCASTYWGLITERDYFNRDQGSRHCAAVVCHVVIEYAR